MKMSSHSTLRRRMILSLGLMVLGSLAIGAGSIIAVNGMHQDLGVAVQGYRQLQQLFSVVFLVSKAREATTANPPQPQSAISALQSAIAMLNQRSDSSAVDGPPSAWVDEAARSDCRRMLSQSIDELGNGSTSAPSLNLLFGRMARVSDDVRQSIADAQRAADHKRQMARESILALCTIVGLGAIVIGIRQYNRVIGPIQQMGEGVRRFAKGNFNGRINMVGDQEFVSLATDFNQMADELQALYRDLEAKVQAKSKELVRSERLASVGYLAAGVAHEINNPLGIIAGYGERAIQQLSEGLNESSLSCIQKALAVICEETFRCKQITDRLLSLAKPSSENRALVSIASVVNTVVSTLSGLGTLGQRKLILNVEPQPPATVLADEGEMKQLILNLVLNALEAVDPNSGVVRVAVTADEDRVELTVVDNGHGMTTATLDKIFEPFFTEKRGQRPGTGLGLSIAQAIVVDHGGQIEAHSDGSGSGSQFIVRLPIAAKEPAIATH